jgi:hypothetical protein
MADVRRKGVKDFPRVNNARIRPEAFSILNRIAGRRCLGSAIEDLCEWYEASRKKNPTKFKTQSA